MEWNWVRVPSGIEMDQGVYLSGVRRVRVLSGSKISYAALLDALTSNEVDLKLAGGVSLMR